MASIFTLKDDDLNDKLNLDELYEKQQQINLDAVNLYKKILGRIHVRIKTTSRQRDNKQFCTYLIPEVMIGVPRYDHAECTAYIIKKLEDNGLNIKYIHPNLLFISWQHWIPGFVRSEVKKQTGMSIDGYGNITDNSKKTNAVAGIQTENANDMLMLDRKDLKPQKGVKLEKEFRLITITANYPHKNLKIIKDVNR